MWWVSYRGEGRHAVDTIGVTTVDTRVSVANAGAMRLHEAFGFVVTARAIGATKLYSPDELASELTSRRPTTADRT